MHTIFCGALMLRVEFKLVLDPEIEWARSSARPCLACAWCVPKLDDESDTSNPNPFVDV